MLKSHKKLWKICLAIYQEAFAKSIPKGDFRKMMKSGEASKPDFFMKYYLPHEKLQEIMDRHCKKNKLTKYEKGKISMEIFLGCSPTGATPEEREKNRQITQVKKVLKTPIFMRRSDGRIEWQCEHGVGHSDKEQAQNNPDLAIGIHGCCHESCCSKPEFEAAVWGQKLEHDKKLCASIMKRHGLTADFSKVE